MASIQAVIDEIRADFAADPDLAGVPFPSYPLEVLNGPFPAIVAYAGGILWKVGTSDTGSGKPAMDGAHTITVQALWPRKDLPRDVAKAMALEFAIPHCLMAGFYRDNWNDTVVALGDANAGDENAIRGTFGSFDTEGGIWAGMAFIGFDFTVAVTLEEEVTVA